MKNNILKLKNLSLQNEVIEIESLVNIVGNEIFSSVQDGLFQGINDQTKIDVGVLLNLFLYFRRLHMVEGRFGTKEAENMLRDMLDNRQSILFLSGVGSLILREVFHVQISYADIQSSVNYSKKAIKNHHYLPKKE